MKTALLTSSETFGRYVFHPGKWLVTWADGKIISNHKIHSLVFPTTVMLPPGVEDSGTTIVKKAIEIKADVIITFGLASEIKGFRIERSGYNWIENLKYCQPYENYHPIDLNHSDKERVEIDLSWWNLDLIKKLFKEKGLPLDPNISDDPGFFSCNSWIYRTVLAIKKYNLTVPYIFIHTACTEETIELIPDFPRDKKMVIPKESTLKALEIFLRSYIVPTQKSGSICT